MLTTLDATKVTLLTLNVPGAAHGIHNNIVFVLQKLVTACIFDCMHACNAQLTSHDRV